MNNKTILIAGATGGIGGAVVRLLHDDGYSLVVTGRNEEKLHNIVKEYPDIRAIPYDFRNLNGIEDIFKFCVKNGDKMDGLVHCTGINRDIPIRANDIETMYEVTTVNYMSFVELTKFFLKKKYSNDNGAIVTVSSLATRGLSKGMCTYAASKAALNAAVVIASKEAVSRGIRVNAVAPAFVDTSMAADAPFASTEYIESLQARGIIPPEAVAQMIEFLLDERSKYISGEIISIPG